MFDNRILRINGSGLPDLELAIKLACKQKSVVDAPIDAWSISGKYGFILYWSFTAERSVDHIVPELGRAHPFPLRTSPSAAAKLVWEWLALPDTWKNNIFDRFTEEYKGDGDNSQGWIVYCEDWGHVAGNHYTICGIKPCYLWQGK